MSFLVLVPAILTAEAQTNTSNPAETRNNDDDDDDDEEDDDQDDDDDDSSSCECDGKVNALTLKYNGTEAATVSVEQRQRGTIFSQVVQPGATFSLTGRDNQNTLGPEITIFINGEESTAIHTSCSKVIEVGQTYGSFTITAGTSRNNGPLCVSENEPGTDIPEVSYPVLFALIGGGIIGGLVIGFMYGKQSPQNVTKKN